MNASESWLMKQTRLLSKSFDFDVNDKPTVMAPRGGAPNVNPCNL